MTDRVTAELDPWAANILVLVLARYCPSYHVFAWFIARSAIVGCCGSLLSLRQLLITNAVKMIMRIVKRLPNLVRWNCFHG